MAANCHGYPGHAIAVAHANTGRESEAHAKLDGRFQRPTTEDVAQRILKGLTWAPWHVAKEAVVEEEPFEPILIQGGGRADWEPKLFGRRLELEVLPPNTCSSSRADG